MKRYRLLAVAVCTGLLVLAGIGASTTQGKTAAPAATQASGTVTLSGWASSPTETKLLREVIRGFEKTFPSDQGRVRARLRRLPGGNARQVRRADAAGRVLRRFERGARLDQAARARAAGPVRRPEQAQDGRFFPSLLNGFKGPDKKLYGFPKDWSPLAMQTNNRLFKNSNVKVPTNWAEFSAAAKKLKVPGGRAICLSPSWDRLLAFVYQNGGTFLNAAKTKSTVNTPAVAQAVNFYVGLIKSGVAGTPAQLGVGWCGEALGKEKAAIVFEGNWLVPFMGDTFPNVAFTNNKMVRGKQDGNLAFTVSYSMARDSKNKPAAWQLIRYLVGQPGMKTWTSKGLALPSRSDVKPVAGRASFIAAAPAARPWQFAPAFTKVMDVANNELTAVLEGKQTVPGMLKKIEQTANDAL